MIPYNRPKSQLERDFKPGLVRVMSSSSREEVMSSSSKFERGILTVHSPTPTPTKSGHSAGLLQACPCLSQRSFIALAIQSTSLALHRLKFNAPYYTLSASIRQIHINTPLNKSVPFSSFHCLVTDVKIGVPYS